MLLLQLLCLGYSPYPPETGHCVWKILPLEKMQFRCGSIHESPVSSLNHQTTVIRIYLFILFLTKLHQCHRGKYSEKIFLYPLNLCYVHTYNFRFRLHNVVVESISLSLKITCSLLVIRTDGSGYWDDNNWKQVNISSFRPKWNIPPNKKLTLLLTYMKTLTSKAARVTEV